jgi:hypothetical protein
MVAAEGRTANRRKKRPRRASTETTVVLADGQDSRFSRDFSVLLDDLRLAVLIAVFGVGAAVWCWFVRRQPLIVAGVGLVWVPIGATWLYMGKNVGYGFLLAGGICLISGGILLWRKRGKEAGEKGG